MLGLLLSLSPLCANATEVVGDLPAPASPRLAPSSVAAAPTSTASIEVTFSITSAVTLTVSSVSVEATSPCEGGAPMAQMVDKGDNQGSINFGSTISTLTAKSVTNGCAFRVEGAQPGLHLVAGLKAAIKVSGHPGGATVTMVRGDAATAWSGTGIPEANLKFVSGHGKPVDWKQSSTGTTVPVAGSRGAVLGTALRSGDTVEHQLAVFLPDHAGVEGTHSASILYTATGS